MERNPFVGAAGIGQQGIFVLVQPVAFASAWSAEYDPISLESGWKAGLKANRQEQFKQPIEESSPGIFTVRTPLR